MHHLIYLAHGPDCFRHEAAYSILSFWRHHAADDCEVIVLTDTPEKFEPLLGAQRSVRYVQVDAEWLATSRGTHDYVHRIKACAIVKALQMTQAAPEDAFLFVDSDTVFICDPAPLLARVAAGEVFLHMLEGTIGGSQRLTSMYRKLYRAAMKYSFPIGGRSEKLPLSMELWNSGVIGFRAEHADIFDSTVDAIDAIYAKVKIHTVEQIALSAVLQSRGVPIQSCDDTVFHYYRFKEFRIDLAAFFSRYTLSTAAQLIDLLHEIDPRHRIVPKLTWLERPKWLRRIRKAFGKSWQPLPLPWHQAVSSVVKNQ